MVSLITASDLSDLVQAAVRLVMIGAAVVHVYRSGFNGRRKTDCPKRCWQWRELDAVVFMFALLQIYGVVFLLLRVFDLPATQVTALRDFILPTTIVSNVLLTVHFLNGQVNRTITKLVQVIQCKLTQI